MKSQGVVIIQTAFPGDVILTGGIVHSIRNSWPEIALSMVVRPDCVQLACMIDTEMTLIAFDKRGADSSSAGMKSIARQIADGPWTAALLPHRSYRSAMLARSALLNPRIGFNIGIQQLFYTESIPYRRGIHEVERNFDLLTELNLKWGQESGLPSPAVTPILHMPSLTIPEEGCKEVGIVLEELGSGVDLSPFAALAPGSVWPTKRWPVAYWIRLAEWLAKTGMGVAWLGGEDDLELCERVALESGVGTIAAGKLSWAGTAALLKRAHLLVANDSAPVHLAGAVGCPSLVLFGPTIPAFGFGPQGKGSRSIGINIGCRPCRLHGSRSCPEGHFRCMKGLKPDSVLRAAVDTIRETSDLPKER